MKFKAQITIFIIIAILIIAIVTFIFMIPQKSKNLDEENFGKVYCKPDQRNIDVCIQLYEPVCGFNENKKQIKTFSNSCFACIDKNIEYYTAGGCK